MEQGKRIILGITGGIAAYKTPDLARLLKKNGFDVQVVMSRSAQQFVTPMTLHSVSGNKVLTSDWETHDDPFAHLSIVKGASAVLVAPATANFLGKLARGLADDLLSTSVLAAKCPLFVAPAMNPSMYSNPAVVENVETLKNRGVIVIPPEVGEMACGDVGEGRMPSIEILTKILTDAVGPKKDFLGKRILVTAGPTEEPIDAVRFISNRSSGKMGVALAEAARDRGAEVTLIHGPVSTHLPKGTINIPVRRASEMFSAAKEHFPSNDILIMAAAVSDFRPAKFYDAKIKKNRAERSLALEQNPDIIETLAKNKGDRLIVGFAAETEALLQNAADKMKSKNMDMICVNDVSRTDIGFDSDHNEVTILCPGQEPTHLGLFDKLTIANMILDRVVSLLPSKQLDRISSGNKS